MSYLLYLRRSFTRTPRRHAVLLAVLSCAFHAAAIDMHPTVTATHGASRQFLLTRSAGETYHIGNATEAELPYFEGISGLSEPVFRDGTIYMHILSDEEWKDPESRLAFENELSKRIEASGNKALYPRSFSYEYAHGISDDPSYISGQRALLLVNVLVILLSVSVLRSAYQNHLRRFSADVGALRACGAGRQADMHYLCRGACGGISARGAMRSAALHNIAEAAVHGLS